MSPPLRVLFILDDFPDPYAGTEGQFWLLFRHLDPARVTPAIMLLRPSEFLGANVSARSLKVLGIERLLSVRSMVRLLRAVWWARRSGFQVAHIFFNDSTIVFPVPLKLFGIRVIVSRRDLGFWYTPAKLSLLKLVSRCVDGVVANCEAVRKAVIRAERFAQDKVVVIYNGIGRVTDVGVPTDRARFGIPEQVSLITIVANLRPLKRFRDAIAMLARLPASLGGVHLLVVGEDRLSDAGVSHRRELEELAAQLGVDGQVHFAGKMQDPMPVVALADLCMLCSETEGLSNTVIEYMLAGKPVVCTDVGGNAELVVPGRTGYLVPVGDVEAMTRAATELLGDRELARLFGTQARERAMAMFSASAMVQRQTQLYERLVHGAPT